MAKGIKLPELTKAELTPAVVKLLEMVQELAQRVQLQGEEIGRLKDEIAVLKKQKKRPKTRVASTASAMNRNPAVRIPSSAV